MDEQFESDTPSDGGGLRRQLEEALAKTREAEAARDAAVKEAYENGRQQAQRRFDALEVFGKDRPGLADAWVEKNPEGDLTTDAAKEFASKFGISLSEEAPTPAPAPEPVPDEVKEAAAAFGASPAGSLAGEQKTYSPEEFAELLRANPSKAEELYRAGALKKEEPEWPNASRFYGRD